MTLEELEAKVRYLEDYISICKLQSTYQHYHHCCMWNDICSLFAQKTQGVELEAAESGVLSGFDAPKRYFGILGKSGPPYPGWAGLHMAVNPVIEINKDGTQAKGVWHSPGYITSLADGKLTAEWCYGKYDMEYVKEDGEWKILKFIWRRTFHTPYDKSWVESGEQRPKMSAITLPQADRPTTYHRPYSPNESIVFEPPPPDKYYE